jgi:hypothetical protein
MKGLNLSLGLTITSFKGRKEKSSSSVGGPSPVPESSLPGEDQK